MVVILKEQYGQTTARSLGVIWDADAKDWLTGIEGETPFVEGDVKLSKDGAVETTILADDLPVFAANGKDLEWTPQANDLVTERTAISFKDQDGPAFLSWDIEIRTIGNAAAYYPYEGVVPVNILSATGYVKNIYWASGGKYYVKESEDIDIPFGFEGNPTGLELWFVIGKDLKNPPLIKKELIEGVDWNVVDIDGVDTVEGVIPFIYADTDTLHGTYTAAAIVKTSAEEAYTGWESQLVVSRPVSRAEDLV